MKNFLPGGPGGKKCSFAQDLRQFKSWRMCEDTPDPSADPRRCPHVQVLPQFRGRSMGLFDLPGGGHAGLQPAAAGCRLVKHLPLFFDLSGRKVVVLGEGPAADRRAALAGSAGAKIQRIPSSAIKSSDFDGAAPTLATHLRGRIEAALPERIGAVARLAATFRVQVNALIGEPNRRRAFWRRLVDGPAALLALAGDDAGARRSALGELDTAR